MKVDLINWEKEIETSMSISHRQEMVIHTSKCINNLMVIDIYKMNGLLVIV